MPGLLGAPDLLEVPGLLGIPGLLGMPDLLEKFCLLFCLLISSLLIGAPTSSGVFFLLLKSFVLDLLVFGSGLFDICLLLPRL